MVSMACHGDSVTFACTEEFHWRSMETERRGEFPNDKNVLFIRCKMAPRNAQTGKTEWQEQRKSKGGVCVGEGGVSFFLAKYNISVREIPLFLLRL
jgi:hypothetical protein